MIVNGYVHGFFSTKIHITGGAVFSGVNALDLLSERRSLMQGSRSRLRRKSKAVLMVTTGWMKRCQMG